MISYLTRTLIKNETKNISFNVYLLLFLNPVFKPLNVTFILKFREPPQRSFL